MEPTGRDHWENVYQSKAPAAVSWYQAAPEPSLSALARFGALPSMALLDVGAGASKLVDSLLGQGWEDLTVLDIAAAALDAARTRLGPMSSKVQWEIADITSWHPPRAYDVWHDRAVFHFLTKPPQREAYRRSLRQGVNPGGLVIIATFATDGPERCSGLPVQRYDAASLAAEVGDAFRLVDSWREDHVTPWGASQSFTWCAFRRTT